MKDRNAISAENQLLISMSPDLVKCLSSPLNNSSEYLTELKRPVVAAEIAPAIKVKFPLHQTTIETCLANRLRQRTRGSSEFSRGCLAASSKTKRQFDSTTTNRCRGQRGTGFGYCVVFSRKVEIPGAALTG
jgi:hypothetical protein